MADKYAASTPHPGSNPGAIDIKPKVFFITGRASALGLNP
jgi:hypothetical protein